MKSLWEPSSRRGQCGKAAGIGLIVSALLSLALMAAVLSGLL